jgi:hypothetical protein
VDMHATDLVGINGITQVLLLYTLDAVAGTLTIIPPSQF